MQSSVQEVLWMETWSLITAEIMDEMRGAAADRVGTVFIPEW